MQLSFQEVQHLPPLRQLLQRHGATLLLAAAVRADLRLGRDCGLSDEHCQIMAQEAGRVIAEACFTMSLSEMLAATGQGSASRATTLLAHALPVLLLDVLRAMLGRPDPDQSLYLEAFEDIHDYGTTCFSVGAEADWWEFMQHALLHPVNQ